MQRLADHHLRELFRAGVSGRAGRNLLTQTQDCGRVTEAANFLKLVRDIEDRRAFGF